MVNKMKAFGAVLAQNSARAAFASVLIAVTAMGPAAQAVPGDAPGAASESGAVSSSVEAGQAATLAQSLLTALRAADGSNLEALRAAVQNTIAESGYSPRVVNAALDALRVCPTGQPVSSTLGDPNLPLNTTRTPSGVLTSVYLLNGQTGPGGNLLGNLNQASRAVVPGQGPIEVSCTAGLSGQLTELQGQALREVRVTVQALLDSLQPAAAEFGSLSGLGAPPSITDATGGGSDYR